MRRTFPEVSDPRFRSQLLPGSRRPDLAQIMAEDGGQKEATGAQLALETTRKRIAERSVLLKAGEKGGCLELESPLGCTGPEPVN